MARKRGGGSGQGQGGGTRPATTPVGGLYKDARRNIQGNEEDEDEDDAWAQVNYNKQKSPTHHHTQDKALEDQERSNTQANNSPPSFASVAGQSSSMQARRDSAASASGMKEKKTLERKLRTPDPDGAMRDDEG